MPVAYFFLKHEEFVLQHVDLNIDEKEAVSNNYRFLHFVCFHGGIIPLFYGEVCHAD